MNNHIHKAVTFFLSRYSTTFARPCQAACMRAVMPSIFWALTWGCVRRLDGEWSPKRQINCIYVDIFILYIYKSHANNVRCLCVNECVYILILHV